MKLYCALLLGFGLKELKIALNVLKVGVHSYLPKNLNSEKLVKNETSSCCFAKVGVKGGENILERRESWSARLSIKWASKSMSKFQF